MSAFHRALEMTPVAFNRVRVVNAANVLLRAVLHCFVLHAEQVKIGIAAPFVRSDNGARLKVVTRGFLQSVTLIVRNGADAQHAVAFGHAEDHRLV